MKPFFKSLILALILISAHSTTFAQTIADVSQTAVLNTEQQKISLAKELTKIFHVKNEWDNLIYQAFHKADTLSTPEELAEVNKIREYLKKEVNIEYEMTKVYSQTYTLEELKSLKDFYGTQNGQAILKKEKITQEKFNDIFIQQIQKIMPSS